MNGPLVWAIDQAHDFLYLFPRECPRVLIWPTSSTTATDRWIWMGQTSAEVVAYVEPDWRERLADVVIYRYEMPPDTFESLNDAGMWVSRSTVTPVREQRLSRLLDRLATRKVELRYVENLAELKPVWNTTLHASGIRLRNAKNGTGYGQPGEHQLQKSRYLESRTI